MSAASALISAFSGSRRHFSTPTRRGFAENVNGVSHVPANSETMTLASGEQDDDLSRLAADEADGAV